MTSTQFTDKVLAMTEHQKDEFFKIIKTQLSEEDYNVLLVHIALESMFKNPTKYKAMKNAVCEQLCEEVYGHIVEKERKTEDAVLISMYSNSIL